MKNIEWMRACSKKNQIKTREANIKRNYRRIYREIKRRAKIGFNQVIIRFGIYDENIQKLQTEGYVIEKHNYINGSTLSIRWQLWRILLQEFLLEW